MSSFPSARQVCDLDSYVTDMQWFPSASQSNAASNDVFAVACSDGTFKIVGRGGRVEKSVEAHRGACISLRWNSDGTALVSVGEDGALKVRDDALRVQRFGVFGFFPPLFALGVAREKMNVMCSNAANFRGCG